MFIIALQPQQQHDYVDPQYALQKQHDYHQGALRQQQLMNVYHKDALQAQQQQQKLDDVGQKDLLQQQQQLD